MENKYIALQPLTWGEGVIQPGEIVPFEEGRDYAALERYKHIAVVTDAGAPAGASGTSLITITVEAEDDVIVRVNSGDTIVYTLARALERKGKKIVVQFYDAETNEPREEKATVALEDVFDAESGAVILELQELVKYLREDLEELTAPDTSTPLPDGFPAKKVLEAAGLTTLETLRAKSEADLIALDGIGATTAAKIYEALAQTG
jgi:hypothetical protein